MAKTSSWLTALVGGTAIGTAAFFFIPLLLVPSTMPLPGRLVLWVASVLLSLPVAVVMAAVGGAIDLALLRWRGLPAGPGAWVLAAVAPALLGTYVVLALPAPFPAGRAGSVLAFVSALGVVPAVVRVLLGALLGQRR